MLNLMSRRQSQRSAPAQLPIKSSPPRQTTPPRIPPYTDVADHTDATTEEEELMLREQDNFDEVAQMARSAYKIGRELLGMVNVEYKRIQTNYICTPSYDGTGTNSLVIHNSCSQGDTDTTRNGDSIKLSGIRVAGYVTPQSTGNVSYFYKLMLVWQPGSNQLTNVFPSAIGAVDGFMDFDVKGTSYAPLATKDLDSSRLFHVLWSKNLYINDTTGPGGSHFEHWVRLDRHTRFENNSSTINNGVLTMICISNVAASNSTVPAVVFSNNVYFVDN